MNHKPTAALYKALTVAHNPLGPAPEFFDRATTVQRRVELLTNTTSHGVPSCYASPFEWARAWVRENGVTLPPDTPEMRSLRNWFCYKVNRFKKGTETQENKRLLALHGIDLSLYQAKSTGRGVRMDDAAMTEKLKAWHASHRTYNLDATADADLREWQNRLLAVFVQRGRSERMVQLESELPGLKIAKWCRPNEVAAVGDANWWAVADLWRAQCADIPAFRGAIDPATPAALALWAQDQQRSVLKITARQRGELYDLGILGERDRSRQRVREAALQLARVDQPDEGYRERDLSTPLGACLYLRLLERNAPLSDIYSTLAITPATHRRFTGMLGKGIQQVYDHCEKDKMRDIRVMLRDHPGLTSSARNSHLHKVAPMDVHEYLLKQGGRRRAQTLWETTRVVMKVHMMLSNMRIVQDLPNMDDFTEASKILRADT